MHTCTHTRVLCFLDYINSCTIIFWAESSYIALIRANISPLTHGNNDIATSLTPPLIS